MLYYKNPNKLTELYAYEDETQVPQGYKAATIAEIDEVLNPVVVLTVDQKIAEINLQARETILAIASEDKQRAMLARDLELIRKELINTQILTVDEQAEITNIKDTWAQIKNVKDKSDSDILALTL